MQISFAVPGAERKRTKLNAPAIAIPAPRLPLTIAITIATAAGISADAIKNDFDERVRKKHINERIMPVTIAEPMLIKNVAGVITPSVKIVSNNFFCLLS